MASPYTAVSIIGYNSSPPPDDGSAVASNQVKWSNNISKIGDPLKTMAQSMDANITTAFALRLLNAVLSKSATYTLANADAGKLVQFTGSSNNTLNLQAAATATADFACAYRNDSTGTLTLDPNSTELINGVATIVIQPGESGFLLCTGTAWFTVSRSSVTLTGTETLTNKTLTSPVINSATGIGQSIIKRKTADETVTSSTTLQDDDHLTFPIAANEEWGGQFQIHVRGSISGHGLILAMTVPSGATMLLQFVPFTDTFGQDVSNFSTVSGSGAGYLPPTGVNGAIHGHLWVLNGANAGNVTLQWCQNTSSGTGLVFKKGSILMATRIA